MKFLYKRVVLKISGEVIKDINSSQLFNSIIINIVKDIKYLLKCGIEISIVVGGGNLFRGLSLTNIGMNKVTSDYIGMLSTIINSLFLKDLFSKYDIPVCLMSSFCIDNICEKYSIERVMYCLSNSIVLIFCGGLGHPFFTTDSAACLRAIETNSDIILKGTKVNGVYSKDPNNCKEAIFYSRLNYQDVLNEEFKIMDLTAFILARDHKIPICIFNIKNKNALYNILLGKQEGTLIF